MTNSAVPRNEGRGGLHYHFPNEAAHSGGEAGRREADMQDGGTNGWMEMAERKDNFTIARLAWLHPNCPCWLWTDFFFSFLLGVSGGEGRGGVLLRNTETAVRYISDVYLQMITPVLDSDQMSHQRAPLCRSYKPTLGSHLS